MPSVFYDHFYDCGTPIHDQIVKLVCCFISSLYVLLNEIYTACQFLYNLLVKKMPSSMWCLPIGGIPFPVAIIERGGGASTFPTGEEWRATQGFLLRIYSKVVELLAQIDVRKQQDIHSRSSIKILEAQPNLYSAIIGEKLSMKIGDGSWSPAGKEWKLATSGHRYAVWHKGDWFPVFWKICVMSVMGWWECYILWVHLFLPFCYSFSDLSCESFNRETRKMRNSSTIMLFWVMI